MRISWFIFLVCLVSSIYGCSDDEGNSSSNGETSIVEEDNISSEGSGEGAFTPVMIGAPEAELVVIDHAAMTSALSANLTQHIDEIDDAISTIEDSTTLENIIHQAGVRAITQTRALLARRLKTCQ